MNFFKTSRKDDMTAAFFVLMSLLNNGNPIGKSKDLALLAENLEDVDS